MFFTILIRYPKLMVDIIKQVVRRLLFNTATIRGEQQECVTKKSLPIENYHLVLMKQRKSVLSVFCQYSWSINTVDDRNFRRIIRAVKRKDLFVYFCHGRNSLALIWGCGALPFCLFCNFLIKTTKWLWCCRTAAINCSFWYTQWP